jgi:hypothetical protein
MTAALAAACSTVARSRIDPASSTADQHSAGPVTTEHERLDVVVRPVTTRREPDVVVFPTSRDNTELHAPPKTPGPISPAPAAENGGPAVGAIPPPVMAAVLCALAVDGPPAADAKPMPRVTVHPPDKDGVRGIAVDEHLIGVRPEDGVEIHWSQDRQVQGGREERHVAGVGAGLQTTSDQATQRFNATAPGAQLGPGGGGSASGGEFSYSGTLSGGAKVNILMLLGGAAAAAGAAAVFIPLARGAAVPLIAGGVMLFVIGLFAAHAEWIWYLAIPVAAAGFVWFIVREHRHGMLAAALPVIVHGTEIADGDAHDQVTTSIANVAGEKLGLVRKAVRWAKDVKRI